MTKSKNDIPKRLKKLVIESMRRHAWNIGYSQYLIDIHWMHEDDGSDDKHLLHAEINVDRRYLKATLKIYPIALEKWKKEGDTFIQHLVAHEISHIATQHLYDVATATYKDEGEMNDAWETLTETVARLSLEVTKLSK